MTDTISLDFIGATLRSIQAEQRTLRMENTLIREMMGRLATREELLDVLRVLAERIGNFEALMQARMDRLGTHLDARVDGLEARIDRFGAHVDARADGLQSGVDRLGTQLADIAGRLG